MGGYRHTRRWWKSVEIIVIPKTCPWWRAEAAIKEGLMSDGAGRQESLCPTRQHNNTVAGIGGGCQKQYKNICNWRRQLGNNKWNISNVANDRCRIDLLYHTIPKQNPRNVHLTWSLLWPEAGHREKIWRIFAVGKWRGMPLEKLTDSETFFMVETYYYYYYQVL